MSCTDGRRGQRRCISRLEWASGLVRAQAAGTWCSRYPSLLHVDDPRRPHQPCCARVLLAVCCGVATVTTVCWCTIGLTLQSDLSWAETA